MTPAAPSILKREAQIFIMKKIIINISRLSNHSTIILETVSPYTDIYINIRNMEEASIIKLQAFIIVSRALTAAGMENSFFRLQKLYTIIMISAVKAEAAAEYPKPLCTYVA